MATYTYLYACALVLERELIGFLARVSVAPCPFPGQCEPSVFALGFGHGAWGAVSQPKFLATSFGCT